MFLSSYRIIQLVMLADAWLLNGLSYLGGIHDWFLCRGPSRTYSMHGGAGALISIGLLRKVDWPSMERCVNHLWSSGAGTSMCPPIVADCGTFTVVPVLCLIRFHVWLERMDATAGNEHHIACPNGGSPLSCRHSVIWPLCVSSCLCSCCYRACANVAGFSPSTYGR